jgi:amino acid adenylation domain-containing protein
MGTPSLDLIHAAVARLAARQPDRTAVVGEDGTAVSYRRLDRLADRWSIRLAERGVRRGGIVPVLMPRSPRLTAVLLAVLRCGAAYAALDRRWPDDRIRAIVAQLAPPLLISDDAGDRFRVPTWNPPSLDEPDSPAGGGGPPRGDVGVDAAACVFFTSGTTGEPKGVVSPHQATTRLFAVGGPMAFGPTCVMPQTVAVTWDAWSLEQWGMLTTGGTSVVVADDYLPPHRLADLVARHGVNTLWLTSSLFNLFVAEEIGCFAGLRRLFIGGERLSTPHVRKFLGKYPEVELWNGYGPVESCVFATTHRITPADCDAPHGVPIGRPVPGTQVLVLDGDRAVGPGEPGELCVAGDGLALGYLGDEALTSARFTDVPVDGRPVRVYRTGDQAVRDASGVYHFIGRTDRQIKLRGHRIELEGLEAQAATVPRVATCAAAPLPGALGEHERLALYYTVSEGGEPLAAGADPLGVREALARTLPPHAVPDVVAAVDRLPLTPNGKADHAALTAAHRPPR